MEWTYVIVAITFLVIGFMLCAILSANKYDQEFISVDEFLKSKEKENENKDE